MLDRTDSAYLTPREIATIPFGHVGREPLISRLARFYSPEQITLGDYCRIDDFTILSGRISTGAYVHVAPFSGIYAGDPGVRLADFVNLSSRVAIYGKSDEMVRASVPGPRIPQAFHHRIEAAVELGEAVILGTGCTVLPGVVAREGATFGAMSMLKGRYEAYSTYAGVPARLIRRRDPEVRALHARARQALDIAR